MAREDLSSVRPNHSCSSQLPRVSNSNRDSNHLNPSLLNSRRLLARHPILNAQTLSYPISHGTFIARLLLHSSNRNSPAMPLHLAPLHLALLRLHLAPLHLAPLHLAPLHLVPLPV